MRFFWKRRVKNRCKFGDLPEQVCSYLAINESQPIKSKTPLRSQRFVVLDTEATGLDYKKDKIISIGAISLQDGMISIEDSFETLIRQIETGDKESIPVHGILKRDLEWAAQEEAALLCFLSYINNSILVAHHADFDKNIINHALQKRFGLALLNPFLDTEQFARRLEKGPFEDSFHNPGDYSLDSLCERYDIELNDRHTSAGDAFLTAKLLQVLLYNARKKRFKNVGDVLK